MTTTRMVQLPSGLRLHTAIAGSGPVVLLVHGFPQTWWCWRRVIDLLATDHLVIAPDYRGAGMSDRPVAGYDKQTIAADLHELVGVLTGQPVEHVIGHDLGAMVATAYAIAHPGISSLTLVDAPVPGTATWHTIAANPKIWHFGFHANVDLASALVSGRERLYIEEFIRVRIGVTGAMTADDVDRYVAAYQRPGALRAAFSTYAAFDTDAAYNSAHLPLGVPTLTIGGSLSTSGPLMGATGAEVSSDHSTHVIDGAGHWIPEEAPDDLVSTWRNWRTAVAASPTP